MTKIEFEDLSRAQQYAEIADALGGGLMTAEEKRYFEHKNIDQQLAEIWDAASNISGGTSTGYEAATDVLYVKSPNAHFWSLTIDNAGAMTLTDVGP